MAIHADMRVGIAVLGFRTGAGDAGHGLRVAGGWMFIRPHGSIRVHVPLSSLGLTLSRKNNRKTTAIAAAMPAGKSQ